MSKIKIDPDKCIGCGTCVLLAPKTFVMNKKGLAEVITQTKKPDQKTDSPKAIQEAIESCATEAITQEEE